MTLRRFRRAVLSILIFAACSSVALIVLGYVQQNDERAQLAAISIQGTIHDHQQ